MILCNRHIHKALDEGRLIIEPEPLPRMPTPGELSPYNTHSVDLMLGPKITIPEKGPYNFDLTAAGLPQFLARNSTSVDLTLSPTFSLKPHQFILGITLERVGLPILPRQFHQQRHPSGERL